MLKLLLGLMVLLTFSKFFAKQEINMLDNFVLNNGKFVSEKPILWLYNDYETNTRNWEDFGSRKTTNLNQPYL